LTLPEYEIVEHETASCCVSTWTGQIFRNRPATSCHLHPVSNDSASSRQLARFTGKTGFSENLNGRNLGRNGLHERNCHSALWRALNSGMMAGIGMLPVPVEERSEKLRIDFSHDGQQGRVVNPFRNRNPVRWHNGQRISA